jgi:hypothetical protein
MVMNKGKNVKFYSSNEVGQYGCTIFPNNVIVCLISFAKKCELVWYVVKRKSFPHHWVGSKSFLVVSIENIGIFL